MHLLSKIAVVATAMTAIGCQDVSGPPSLPATYILGAINGRPLPTALSSFPESPIVLAGSLYLDASGNAGVTELRSTMLAPGQVTYNTNYTYTISGNTIQFHLDCPLDALCSAPPVGVFKGSHLFLDFSGSGQEIVYDYQVGVSN